MNNEAVGALVADQLARIEDRTVAEAICRLLVDPFTVERPWDYGEPDQKFECWTVLEHEPSNTGIAYCALGFGPSYPWGLVSLTGVRTNIGMDCAWYSTLEDAFRESQAFDGQNLPKYEVS